MIYKMTDVIKVIKLIKKFLFIIISLNIFKIKLFLFSNKFKNYINSLKINNYYFFFN